MSEAPKTTQAKQGPQKPASTRLIFGVLILSTVMFAIRKFDLPSCLDLQSSIEGWGAVAPALFVAIYIVATLAFIPSVILTVAAGLAFGPWFGTAYALIGATLGATAAFLVARYVAGGRLEAIISRRPWFARFKNNIETNGFNYALFVRLVPVFPSTVSTTLPVWYLLSSKTFSSGRS